MTIDNESLIKTPFIVSPSYDYFYFIISPLWAIALAYLLTFSIDTEQMSDGFKKVIEYREVVYAALFSPFIHAHLFLVFFRSHLNKKIFTLYPIRFIVAPIALGIVMYLSHWFIVFVAAFLVVWWDVYHSSMQTFGLGRIYDSKAGNNAQVGRRLDFWLNVVIYIGPILGGVTFVNHLNFLKEFNSVEFGKVFFTTLPIKLYSISYYIRTVVLIVGISYLIYYLYAYYRLHKEGYKISMQKIFLYEATAICTLLSWGFNSIGQAFFIVNFFHALQYFAIVWHSEQNNLMSVMRLTKLPFRKVLLFLIIVGISYTYGWIVVYKGKENYGPWFWNITLVVSVMHFWYDGFIWSVRKKQV